MRFMWKLLLHAGAVTALAALAGCAAPPPAVVDAGKLSTVRTVTVVYSDQSFYSAGRAHMTMMPTGGGVMGAALTGTITGLANANSAKQNVFAFNDVVKAKLGDTRLNRRFIDGLEAALRSHGYIVKEVDASTPTLPTFTHDDQNHWQAGGPVYRDTDAVLVTRVSAAYNSSGPMSAYSRLIRGEIVMFKGDTHEPVFRQRVYWMKAIDPYSYHSMDEIVADLPHAIGGLDESMLAQVPLFDKSLEGVQH